MSGLATSVRTWADMIKLAHSVFALPFAALALFLAARPEPPTALQSVLILACMVGARSAAMTFNRIVDAEIDAANPRTAMRPLPAGRLTRRDAWSFFAASCGVFLLGCAGFWWSQGNIWPLALSLPTLLLVCVYSYTKRFTSLSHLVLGAAIAFSPVATWIAISPATLGAPAWLLMAAVATWIAGFDIIYACQDVDFDRRRGLFSIPARLGVGRALLLVRGLHAVAVGALVGVGLTADLGAWYFSGVVCVAALLTIENAIIHPHDLSRVNLAFFTTNGIVGVVLGVCGVIDVLTG